MRHHLRFEIRVLHLLGPLNVPRGRRVPSFLLHVYHAGSWWSIVYGGHVPTGGTYFTLRDHVRNDNIKERLKVESIAERCRKARLRWFGHVKRRDQEYVGRKTMEMAPPGRRKRGRSKQRWMDCVNRDMRAIGTTSDEVHDRTGWRRIVSAAATPQPSGSG